MSMDSASHSQMPAFGASQPEHGPRRTGVRIVVYLVLLSALGLIAWRIYRNHQQAIANTERQAAMLMGRPAPVQVVNAVRKAMPIYLTGLGTVTPYMSVTVKARVGGELLPVHFTEGQEVRQGETIMTIDPRPYKAALDQAKGTLAHDEALLKNAQAEYKRYKALYDAGVTSKEALEADEATLGQYQGAIASDKAAVETAQLQLSWCTIQSPINGRIGLRLVDPGNIIQANTTNLVVINQFRPIAVYFTLPENQLPPVLKKLATDRRIAVEAFDRSDVNKLASGQLLAADNQIDTTTGTARLKAVFSNENEALYPNQFVNIHLELENRPQALVVPSAAIQMGLQGSFVWVIDKDEKGQPVAQMQPVKVALVEGQVTILDSGPEHGEQVVVDGAERLRPGQLVTVSTGQGQQTQNADAMPAGGPFSGGGSAAGPTRPAVSGDPARSGRRDQKVKQ